MRSTSKVKHDAHILQDRAYNRRLHRSPLIAPVNTISTMIMKQLVFLLFLPTFLLSQDTMTPYKAFGSFLVSSFSSAPFPHRDRINGHSYDNKLYPPERHYVDSSVAMFIPRGYRQTGKVDLVFHFHGWHNNIDTTFKKYRLAEQFYESGKNAILVVPEGPRNAPDSFGGKLEDADGFKKLVHDVLQYLRREKKIKTTEAGRIILSGHSGGYHVISFILMRGGLTDHIKEVFLFDGLYGQTEKYVYWLDHHKGKMINIYTKDGGTKEETESLMADLDGWGVPYRALPEEDAKPGDLKKNKLIFLFTSLQHDEVMQVHSSFNEYLKASILSDR